MKKQSLNALAASYRADLLYYIERAKLGKCPPHWQAYCFGEIAAAKGTDAYPEDGDARLDELHRLYRDAVVAVEDHRFYSHGGVDFIALCRALWNDVCAGAFVEGGSTITQQLAKNLYFTQEKVLTRKAAEAFMAWAIEKQYTKDEILELYVNSIYFGSGYYNVRPASEGYFGKAPAQMTPYECTLLAGVPNAPSAYDPAQNPGLARQRQKKGVEQMVERGCLSAAQAREALTPG